MQSVIHWAPRLIGIGAILFISLFALDVFEPDVPPLEIAVALFMHLLPSFALAALLAFAWRFELIGGIAFIAISLLPFVFLPNEVWVNVLLAAPFTLTGALFVLGWVLKARTQR